MRILFFLLISQALWAQFTFDGFEKEWAAIHSAEKDGLPQSALNLLDQLVQKTKSANNPVQFVRAITHYREILQNFPDYHPNIYLDTLSNAYLSSDFPAKNILAFFLGMQKDEQTYFVEALDPRLIDWPSSWFLPLFDEEAKAGLVQRPTVLDVLIHQAPLDDKSSFYQYLIDQHTLRKDTAALIHTLLQSQVKSYDQLITLHHRFSTHPESAEILYEQALLDLYTSNSNPKALNTCLSCIAQYPNSYGAGQCKNLINQIQSTSFSIITKQVYPSGSPFLVGLTFKNLSNIHYALIPVKMETWVKWTDLPATTILKSLQPKELKSLDIPQTFDYGFHTTEFMVTPPSTGTYVLLVSDRPDPLDTSAIVQFSFLTISNIAWWMQNDEYMVVVDRTTGLPLKNIKIEFFENKDYRFLLQSKNRKVSEVKTDERGIAYLPAQFPVQYSYKLSSDSGDEISPLQVSRKYTRYDNENSLASTFILTDKAIYKPGETIQYSLITYPEKKVPVTILLYNSDGELKGEQKLTTDDFGTANGQFSLDSVSATGAYSIQSSYGNSTIFIQVEAYVKPAFELELNVENDLPKLGDTLVFTGRATAFSGRNVVAGIAEYKIYKKGGLGRGYFPKTLVASGKTVSDGQGYFDFSYVTDSKDEVAQYDAEVRFTDLLGSVDDISKNILLRKLPLNVQIIIEDKNPDQLKVEINSALGKPVASPSQLFVYRLKQTSDGVKIDRDYAFPDIPLISASDFEKYFPQYAYTKEEMVKEKLVFSTYQVVQPASKIDLPTSSWKTGKYLVEVIVYDGAGTPMTLSTTFEITPNVGKIEKDIFTFHWEGRPVLVYWENMKGASKPEWYSGVFKKEITLEDQGNFIFHLQGVRYNQFFKEYFVYKIPYRANTLEILPEKIDAQWTPGQQVEWTFSTNPKGLGQYTAVVYDEALDLLANQSWKFDPFRYLNYSNAYILSGMFGLSGYYGVAPMQPKSLEFPTRAYPYFKGLIVPWQGVEMVAMRSAEMDKSAVNGEVEKVELRKDFSEVAFFTTRMRTDQQGLFQLDFKLPETLTRWKMKILALDSNYHSGLFETSIPSRKPYFIDAIIPSFVRKGDRMVWNTEVVNQTGKLQKSTAVLSVVGLLNETKSGDFNWNLDFKGFDPDSAEVKLSAASATYSDGLEGKFPVLSDRQIVEEQYPFILNAGQKMEFSLSSLKYPSEVIFEDQVQLKEALLQPAFKEAENTHDMVDRWYLAMLNKDETSALASMEWLKAVQNTNGGFPWFPGGYPNVYSTLYVLENMARFSQTSESALQFVKESIERKYAYSGSESKVTETEVAYFYIKSVLNRQDFSKAETHFWYEIQQNWSTFNLRTKAIAGLIFAHAGLEKEKQRIAHSLRETIFLADQLRGKIGIENLAYIHLFYEKINASAKIREPLKLEILKFRRVNANFPTVAVHSVLGTGQWPDTKLTRKVSFNYKQENGIVEIQNPNATPVWVTVKRKYQAPMEELHAFGKGPLKIYRKYFVFRDGKWVDYTPEVTVNRGERIKVRLEVISETAMDFVAIHDGVPAGAMVPFERSRHHWSGGLTYYKSNKMGKTQFFIEHLPEGIHTLEYELTIIYEGEFSSGLSVIESTFADGFTGFDQNVKIISQP
jgi:hypothetical protein